MNPISLKKQKQMAEPTLYNFSGLPGVGKSTLAKLLAKEKSCAYLRIDTIEKGMIELCSFDPKGEGYAMAHLLAQDNLGLGISVVADCCNPWKLTREGWENLAIENMAHCINIEIVCSDADEHKGRVEKRYEKEPNHNPNWEKVINRDYRPWHKDILKFDTAHLGKEEAFRKFLSQLEGYQKKFYQ